MALEKEADRVAELQHELGEAQGRCAIFEQLLIQARQFTPARTEQQFTRASSVAPPARAAPLPDIVYSIFPLL